MESQRIWSRLRPLAVRSFFALSWVLLRYLFLVLLLAVLPFVTNEYQQYVINVSFVYVLVSVGYNVILGFAGQFAFANHAILAVGAYATALLSLRGLSVPLAIIVSALSGALVCMAMLIPALRLSRYYLAIATVSLGEAVRWILVNWYSVTGGPRGVRVPAVEAFGWVLSRPKEHYWLILPVVVGLVLLTNNLLRSGLGRALVAIRENPVVAQSLGIDLAFYRLVAFAWGGSLVGIAGGLLAIAVGFVSPESFGLAELVKHFTMIMIGGVGTMTGPVLGAVLVSLLSELLRSTLALQEMLFGLLLLAILLVVPDGMAGSLQRILGKRESLLRDL